MIVKPNPRGGDKGVPVTDQEVKKDAMKVFDAIHKNEFFYCSSKPAEKLINGEVEKAWIVKCAYDVVREMQKLHTTGISATIWTMKDNLTTNASDVHQLKKVNELDITYEARMDNVLLALRIHKAIALDVVQGRLTVSAFVLNPKENLQAKLRYKSSNDGRGKTYEQVKAKAAKFEAMEAAKKAAE